MRCVLLYIISESIDCASHVGDLQTSWSPQEPGTLLVACIAGTQGTRAKLLGTVYAENLPVSLHSQSNNTVATALNSSPALGDSLNQWHHWQNAPPAGNIVQTDMSSAPSHQGYAIPNIHEPGRAGWRLRVEGGLPGSFLMNMPSSCDPGAALYT